MAKRRPKPDVLHPAYTKPRLALDRIANELDGREWNADTLEIISRICTLAGYDIREPADIDQAQADHQADDPHCTCNDCIADHARRLESSDQAEAADPTEGRTIWNSDGTDGPVLICPPPEAPAPQAARYYLVTAHRTTDYRVKAETDQAAIDAMLDGGGAEVGGETHQVTADLDDDQAERPEAPRPTWPKVYVVILEWNRPPSEVTGDPGLVGVYATLESAEAAALAERKELDEQGETVYQYTPDEPEENWTIDVHVREAEVEP